MTRAEVIAKIEGALADIFAEANHRNAKSMRARGCSEDDIQTLRELSDDMLKATTQQVVLQVLGSTIVGGPESTQ